MPRKVLITKETLEEILAKYQGGGSGGGVNVESNIIDVKFTSVEGILHFYFWKEKWNEFLQSKSLTEQQFLDGFNNANSKLELFTLFNQLFSPLADLLGVVSFYQSVQIYDGDNNQFFAEKPLVSIKPYVDDLDNPTYFTLTVYCLSGMQTDGANHNALTDLFMLLGSEYNATFTASISTLDIVNVTGGQGGGTVDAEPIISIKMTNVDACIDEETELNTIVDFQLYCTKERWDNFVSLASSQFQTDITYANFETVFKQLNRLTQMFAIGYLMMDYYDGKVLPITFVKGKTTNSQGSYDDIYQLKNCITAKDATLTNNIEIVMVGNYRNSQNESVAWAIPNDLTPTTQEHMNFVTTNTVITVEEIEGPAIGSGSSSGTSTTEFYADNGLIQMKSICNTGSNYTLTSYVTGKDLLSVLLFMKQHSPIFSNLPITENTTTHELVGIVRDAVSNNNLTPAQQCVMGVQFMDFGFGKGIDIASYDVNGEQVSNFIFDDASNLGNGDAVGYKPYSGATNQLLFMMSDLTEYTFEIEELTSGTIQVSGGSGSSESADALEMWNVTLLFGIDKEMHLDLLMNSQTINNFVTSTNTTISDFNSLNGTSIPTLTDFSSESFNTVLSYCKNVSEQVTKIFFATLYFTMSSLENCIKEYYGWGFTAARSNVVSPGVNVQDISGDGDFAAVDASPVYETFSNGAMSYTTVTIDYQDVSVVIRKIV